MAKKPKADKGEAETIEATAVDVVQDVEETPPQEAENSTGETVDQAEDTQSDAEPDAEIVPEPVEEAAEAIAEETPSPAPEIIRETVVERKAGFVPMALGGAVAACLGILGVQYYDNNIRASETEALKATISKQADQITSLQEQVANIPAPDTSDIEAAVSDAQTQISVLADRANALEVNVTKLARRPAGNAGGSVDLSGVESELDGLRADLDAQKGTLAQMIQEAQDKKDGAEAAARRTIASGAVARIGAALESGAPFAAALSEFRAHSDIAVPAALSGLAEAGAPTLTQLTAKLPEAARQALAAARAADPEAGVGAFITRQLGIRSVAPKEGGDPDAVLSRMEAAVKSGDLASALGEMDALPDAAKAPLAPWAEQAQSRLAALGAAGDLSAKLNSQ